jgi:hypothetical protein
LAIRLKKFLGAFDSWWSASTSMENPTMTTFTPARVLTLALLALAIPAQAVNDFNSSRSNRERGTLAAASAPARAAQDFNTTRSNKERGAVTHVHGDPHVDQATAGSSPPADSMAPPSPAGTAAQKNKSGHVTLMK